MKRLRIAFAVGFSFIVSAMSADEKTMDALFSEFDGPGTPGAAVMVIKNGNPVFAKAYGMADTERNVRCAIETNFRLASVSKQFTATAVLILAERGKLSLEDSISRFFPEFPEHGKKITVRHLLTHTSGLIDYEDVIPAGTTIQLSDRDVLMILREHGQTYFPPGTQFRYSNSGYALLALLVEVASGNTFPAFLRENIFKPLDMTNTVAYVPGISVVPNRAFGYAKRENIWRLSDQSVTSAVLGDGGIYSSAVDLAKWDQALYTGKVVSRNLLDQAFTAHSRKSDFGESGYGFGWYVGNYRGVRSVWHYGSTCGFRTHLARFPEKKLTLILLTNRREADLQSLARKVTELYW